MSILFVNRLTVIDFSYLSPSRGLVGESWQVDLELDGDLNDQGMVLDFGEVKRTVKHLIDEHFDHKLIVPAEYAGLKISDYPDGTHLSFTLENGHNLEHRSPRDAIRQVPVDRITADRMSQVIADRLSPHTPDNVNAIKIRLWPERIDGAFYHYSHGLKHHDGNCQRIAHGHRSRIEIFRNGDRDIELERRWSTRWTDIYIGTREDLIGTSSREGTSYCEFGYRSAQGEFGLTLPKDNCYLIDTDSTVENIAQHIAATLKAEAPDDQFQVYAYEGVDKGAVGLA